MIGWPIKFTGLFRADLEIAEAQGGFLFDWKIETEAFGIGRERQSFFVETNAVRCPTFAVSERIGPADILALKRLAGNDREAGNAAETEVVELQHERPFREHDLAVGVEGKATGDMQFVGSVFESAQRPRLSICLAESQWDSAGLQAEEQCEEETIHRIGETILPAS